jgi:pyruvate-formate lyase
MTPCPGCSRHVRDDEPACPFCASALATPRPRAPVLGRVTRAAVFSAALVACGGKKDEAKPAAGSAEHLDQDFNQLLGSAEGSAPPAAIDAGIAQVAADAPAAIDAGLTDEERTRQLQHAQEEQQRKRREQIEEQQQQQQLRVQQHQRDWHNVAKPYGAPPARRRIV